jgi:peptidoglycan/xylan/chitin deacetylase (PgdA/CDA1 family)
MTILCYHSVEPGWESPLAVDPAVFEEHCRWLSEHRDVIPLEDAAQKVDTDGRLPRGTVALTFDDGFAALAEHAFPVLVRYRLPATVFLVAKTLTGEDFDIDWVDTPPPWPMRTLTPDEVLEARAAGIRFASHSYGHADLTTLDERACEGDLRSSREVIEQLLAEPVDLLAYPRGRHDAGVRRAAERAGYRYSLSLPEGTEPKGPHAVPRAGIWPGNTSRALAVKTQPWYLPLRQSPVFPVVKRVLRRTSGR